MKDIFKEVLRMQSQFLEQLKTIRVEGSAGGGMVKIEMDGQHNVLAVKIEPQIFEEKDVSMLEDLIVAAFNDANKKLLEKSQTTLKSITGLPIGL